MMMKFNKNFSHLLDKPIKLYKRLSKMLKKEEKNFCVKH